MRYWLAIIGFALITVLAAAQAEPQGPIQPRVPIKPDKQHPAQAAPDDQSSNQPGQASSKESRGDTSAPLGDLQEHPDSDTATTGEMHLWNPHKADKDVEVGDYHMRRRNYPAAESRYREALDYQNNNAPAMYGLAEALEKQKKNDEAIEYYGLYLKTLPHGPKADDAKSALHRLGAAVPQNTGTIAGKDKLVGYAPQRESETCVAVFAREHCPATPNRSTSA
ncbi:MAG TPA: tetratricopeptide repeat protein [Terriglobales bacterium]|nr:tetratricopeptide repeat protein [Terriglobales bacterium]